MNGYGTDFTVSLEHFILKMYLDTNVLLDFFEGNDDTCSLTFLNLIKDARRTSPFYKDYLQLTISPQVYWELLGNLKINGYFRRLVNQNSLRGIKYITSRARRLKNMSVEDIQEIQNILEQKRAELRQLLGLTSLNEVFRTETGQNDYHVDLVEQLIMTTSLSYKDAIVIASAMIQEVDVFITNDQEFKKSISQLQQAEIPSTQLTFRQLTIFPREIKSLKNLNQLYTEVINKKITEGILRPITRVKNWYRNEQVIGMTNAAMPIQIGSHLVILKLPSKKSKFEREPLLLLDRVKKGHFRNYHTNEPCQVGTDVTIKLSENTRLIEEINLQNSLVFLLA